MRDIAQLTRDLEDSIRASLASLADSDPIARRGLEALDAGDWDAVRRAIRRLGRSGKWRAARRINAGPPTDKQRGSMEGRA